MLYNGVNISAVKDMLGHADETTTLKHYIYNTITNQKTEEMVLNALSDKKVTKSDHNIIQFTGQKKAENSDSSKLSAT